MENQAVFRSSKGGEVIWALRLLMSSWKAGGGDTLRHAVLSNCPSTEHPPSDSSSYVRAIENCSRGPWEVGK